MHVLLSLALFGMCLIVRCPPQNGQVLNCFTALSRQLCMKLDTCLDSSTAPTTTASCGVAMGRKLSISQTFYIFALCVSESCIGILGLIYGLSVSHCQRFMKSIHRRMLFSSVIMTFCRVVWQLLRVFGLALPLYPSSSPPLHIQVAGLVPRQRQSPQQNLVRRARTAAVHWKNLHPNLSQIRLSPSHPSLNLRGLSEMAGQEPKQRMLVWHPVHDLGALLSQLIKIAHVAPPDPKEHR